MIDRVRQLRVALILVGLAVGLPFMAGGIAAAVPPGGPSANTPGTSSALNSSSYSPGSRISFKLKGFPAGETVSVKIDDGTECGAAAVHGACVIYKQRISKGATVGSFTLPKDLKPGKHSLRFLASGVVDEGKPTRRVVPFTLRSPTFTIKSTQKSAPSNTTNKSSNNSTTTSNTSNNTSTSSTTPSTSTAPTTTSTTSASPSPSATKKAKKKAKKSDKSTKEKKASAVTKVSGEAGMVTPEPVTAVVTGAGLSVAQAIGVGGGAVGLAAIVGGLTAWWRRGDVG